MATHWSPDEDQVDRLREAMRKAGQDTAFWRVESELSGAIDARIAEMEKEVVPKAENPKPAILCAEKLEAIAAGLRSNPDQVFQFGFEHVFGDRPFIPGMSPAGPESTKYTIQVKF